MKGQLFIALLLLSIPGWGWAMDTVTLKSGEKMTGLVEDSLETPDQIELNRSAKVGILDTVKISKADIAQIERGDGSDDPAYTVQLPANSEEALWYESLIKKQLDRWIARNSKSPLLPRMQEKREAFLVELEKVKSGLHRVGDRWLSPEEFKEVNNDRLAKDLVTKMSQSSSNLLPFDLLEQINSISQTESSPFYPDVIEQAKKSVDFLSKNLTTQSLSASVDRRMSQVKTQIAVESEFIRQTANQPAPSTSMASSSNSVRGEDGLYYNPEDIMGGGSATSSLPGVSASSGGGLGSSGSDSGYGELKPFYLPNSHPKIRLSSNTMELLRSKISLITDYRYQLEELQKEKDNTPHLFSEVLNKLHQTDASLANFDPSAMRRAVALWSDCTAALNDNLAQKAADIALQACALWPKYNGAPARIDQVIRVQLASLQFMIRSGKIFEADDALQRAQKLLNLLPSDSPRRKILEVDYRKADDRLLKRAHAIQEIYTKKEWGILTESLRVDDEEEIRVFAQKLIAEAKTHIQRSQDSLSESSSAIYHLNVNLAYEKYDEAADEWPENPDLTTAKNKLRLFIGLYAGGVLMAMLFTFSFVRYGIPMFFARFKKPNKNRKRLIQIRVKGE
jgi:hypothetical protein